MVLYVKYKETGTRVGKIVKRLGQWWTWLLTAPSMWILPAAGSFSQDNSD
jgi:hypothetical protein